MKAAGVGFAIDFMIAADEADFFDLGADLWRGGALHLQILDQHTTESPSASTVPLASFDPPSLFASAAAASPVTIRGRTRGRPETRDRGRCALAHCGGQFVHDGVRQKVELADRVGAARHRASVACPSRE